MLPCIFSFSGCWFMELSCSLSYWQPFESQTHPVPLQLGTWLSQNLLSSSHGIISLQNPSPAYIMIDLTFQVQIYDLNIRQLKIIAKMKTTKNRIRLVKTGQPWPGHLLANYHVCNSSGRYLPPCYKNVNFWFRRICVSQNMTCYLIK